MKGVIYPDEELTFYVSFKPKAQRTYTVTAYL